MITVRFHTGRVSIQRGRVTRRYTPSKVSMLRLSNLAYNGPTTESTTIRSFIFTWQGLSTLSHNQRAVYALFLRRKEGFNSPVTDNAYYHILGIRDACVALGINPVLLRY
jgi:hypothetical protein